mgnify:CR=1 FL=1
MFVNEPPSICHRSKTLESTISMQSRLAMVIDKHDILGIDIKDGNLNFKVPILGMHPDERVWSIYSSGPLTSICTVFRNLEVQEGGHPKVMWVPSIFTYFTNSFFLTSFFVGGLSITKTTAHLPGVRQISQALSPSPWTLKLQRLPSLQH